MNSTAPISLDQVFDGISSFSYVVMKTLPDAEPVKGSDIDILCEDQIALGRVLIRNCRPLIDLGYTIRVRQLAEQNQTHIDLMCDEQIMLRLDLHQDLSGYPGLSVRETFAGSLLSRREWAEVETGSGSLRLAVPEKTDNLVLRYLEYHAFFAARPDKVKHADAVAEQIALNHELQRAFFDRLAEATTTRPVTPVLQHCDLNLRRQLTWLVWSIRDKIAWRIRRAKELLMMAVTEPGEFTRKLTNKLIPRHA